MAGSGATELRKWLVKAKTMSLRDPKARTRLAQLIAVVEEIAATLEEKAKLDAPRKAANAPVTARHHAVQAKLRAMCKDVREEGASGPYLLMSSPTVESHP